MRKVENDRQPDEVQRGPFTITELVAEPASARSAGLQSIFSSIGTLKTFDSLHEKAFRWFFFALLSQMASMNMQMLVRGWLVFKFTNSYGALGVVSLCNAVPGLALSLAGGVLADRVRQKKYVVQVGQVASAANAGIVAVLLFTNLLNYHMLLVTAVAQGTIQALMMPSRQAMLSEVAGRDLLMNAVALSSAGMNSMRLLAPAVGGVLLAIVGARFVYSFMTCCYIAAALFLLRVPETTPEKLEVGVDAGRPSGNRRQGSIREGFRYVIDSKTLRAVLSVNLIFILLSMPYLQLLPGYVTGVMHEGPDKLGYLMSVTGVGSLIGALAVASMPNRKRGMLFLVSTLIQGVALVAFSASSWFLISLPIMLVLGLGQSGRQSFSNVLVQEYTEDEYRGRVMSIYMLQFSLMSFSTFFVGIISSFLGPQEALGGTSVVLVLFCLFVIAFGPRLRNLQ